MIVKLNRLATFLSILGVLALGPAVVRADDQKDDKKPAADAFVDLECWVIRATKKNSNIDAELKPLADKLKSQFKLTGFKREKKLTNRTKMGSTYSSELIRDYHIDITPKERKAENDPKKDAEPKKESGDKKEPEKKDSEKPDSKKDDKKPEPKGKDEKKPEAAAPDKNAPLQIQVVITKKGEVKPLSTQTYTVKPGEFQLLGGLKLDGDDTLIVAVSGK